ncbi:MAG TPA: LPS assembly lipoprotein LptE [Bryobacteraceae bacterium]|nr:LPS assembly lipoprotein LptE [Bryobacteraceae bacterium]
MKLLLPALAGALALAGCGYHVAGTANLLPAEIHTIAIVPWANVSMQYKLSDYLAEAVSREMITRTRYKIVADPAKADAVLSGSVVNFISTAAVADPTTARSTGAQIIVQVQVRLVDKTGKVLFERPNVEFRDRYEISIIPQQYFDENGAALARLSRDVARTVVSAILENF